MNNARFSSSVPILLLSFLDTGVLLSHNKNLRTSAIMKRSEAVNWKVVLELKYEAMFLMFSLLWSRKKSRTCARMCAHPHTHTHTHPQCCVNHRVQVPVKTELPFQVFEGHHLRWYLTKRISSFSRKKKKLFNFSYPQWEMWAMEIVNIFCAWGKQLVFGKHQVIYWLGKDPLNSSV